MEAFTTCSYDIPRWPLAGKCQHTAKPGQVTPRTTYTYGNVSVIHYQREDIVQEDEHPYSSARVGEDTLWCKNEEHLPREREGSCRLLYSPSWKVHKWRRMVVFLSLIHMLVEDSASFHVSRSPSNLDRKQIAIHIDKSIN
jgi:hypothetical protein